MRIEVDQSGKIEQTDMDTVVAFSNIHQYAVLLTKDTKRRLIKKYRKEKQIILKLFVASVYYTIKDYIHEAELLIIDNEYDGKQNYIKSLLLDFIRRDYIDFDKNLIRIAHITKKSKAHEVAGNVKRGFAKPQKTLSEKDMEKMIQGALVSRPASTALSAKLRHGLAWHPSSTLLNSISYYLNFSIENNVNIKRIRVRAKPPFLYLRRGFVQQPKLLTTNGINAIRHSPVTLTNDAVAYLNLSKLKISEVPKIRSIFQHLSPEK